MDGSDDYFDDDIVLDETTLAAIDLEEQKWQQYQQQQSQLLATGQRRPIPQDAPLPNPKKQKTSHVVTADGLVAGLRRITVGQDYDEDLPDISIIGDGSYKLPAAQRESANELAAQIRRPSGVLNGASTLNSIRVPPAPARVPTRQTLAPVPARQPFTRHGSGGSNATASGSGQSQGPSTTGRLQNGNAPLRRSTLSAVQAALADFVPSPINPAPQPTPFSHHSRSSRTSPPPRPSKHSSASVRTTRSSFTSSDAVRPHIQGRNTSAASLAPAPAPRGVRGSSPSISIPTGRRLSTESASRPRVVSPAIPPQPPPQLQHHPPLSQGHQERDLRIEVETLKAQIEELLKAQQKTTTELEEARNVRYAKEGEVSILRKNIEKNAKDHAAEVARIKTAKEEAEAMQAQIRKEMREELERMKTHYIFKQHELETARSKTPWTVRTKRTEYHPPPTPVSASAQKRRQTQATPGVNAEADDPLRTPVRSNAQVGAIVSPKRQPRKKIIHIPETPPKTTGKLGFINTFSPPPPIPPPSQINDHVHAGLSQASQSTQVNKKAKKGKGRAEVVYDFSDAQTEDLFFNPPTNDGHNLFSPLGDEERTFVLPDVEVEPQPQSSASMPSSSAEPLTHSQPARDEDVEMKDGNDEQPPEPPEPPEPLEPLLEPDWTRELQKIVLTHKHLTVEQATLQLLIDHPLPSTASSKQVQDYMAGCAKLLDILGTISVRMTDIEADQVFRDLTDVLCALGDILCSVRSAPQLAALLDLVKIAAVFIPTYVSVMLAPSGLPGSGNAAPVILTLLCNTVRALLPPKEGDGLDEYQNSLATEVLGLLEAIAWNCPPELAMRLTVFIRTADVLSVLINKDQPPWLVHRTLRVFSFIASYRGLNKHFLAFHITDDPEDEADKEYSRIPHIERLAAMLIDPRYDEPEGRSLKQSILHFITTLFLVRGIDTDARDVLLHSDTLAHSVVLFLMNITAPMYEEDEDFMNSPELCKWTVDTLILAVVFIYHLFKGSDFFMLRQKLSSHRKRIFNGLFHMFTVSLGRISYAPAPDAIATENRMKVEKVCDLARDVLEMVVDGPELESIWEAFQAEGAHPAPRTLHHSDNESEARILHSDND